MTAKPKKKRSFYFARTPLLIGFERRCASVDCSETNHVSLTKSEAIGYRGFDCSHCGCWNDDKLIPQDLPDSWRTETFH